MSDQNKCTVGDKTYIAITNDDIEHSCGKCAGHDEKDLCIQLALCSAVSRQDKRNINWIEDEK
jgi:hypothetical protein